MLWVQCSEGMLCKRVKMRKEGEKRRSCLMIPFTAEHSQPDPL